VVLGLLLLLYDDGRVVEAVVVVAVGEDWCWLLLAGQLALVHWELLPLLQLQGHQPQEQHFGS
jgi:hypothetical protein